MKHLRFSVNPENERTPVIDIEHKVRCGLLSRHPLHHLEIIDSWGFVFNFLQPCHKSRHENWRHAIPDVRSIERWPQKSSRLPFPSRQPIFFQIRLKKIFRANTSKRLPRQLSFFFFDTFFFLFLFFWLTSWAHVGKCKLTRISRLARRKEARVPSRGNETFSWILNFLPTFFFPVICLPGKFEPTLGKISKNEVISRGK